MKTKVIVNPDSKPIRIKKYLHTALSTLRKQGFRPSVYFIKGSDEVCRVTRQFANEGYDAFIVAGGDGTINEVINGLVDTKIPLGILPFGGSNVLAREMNLPLEPVHAAHIISQKNIRKIDLGLINNHYFSMMASCGYDSYTVSRTSRKIKKILHNNAYIVAGLKDFAGYQPKIISVQIDNDKVVEGTFVIISNTHLYGGSHELTPFASVEDGYLDVCVYLGRYQFGLVHFALNVFSKQHLTMKNVRYFRAKKVYLFGPESSIVQVDGDPFQALPVTIEVVPKALSVFANLV